VPDEQGTQDTSEVAEPLKVWLLPGVHTVKGWQESKVLPCWLLKVRAGQVAHCRFCTGDGATT